MASVKQVVENFEDLGFCLEDPKAIDRLVSLCDIYCIDEAKLSYEYLAFASQKKVTSAQPTVAILESFEKELSKSLSNSKSSRSALECTSANVYDSSTLPSLNTSENADFDDSAISFYGTPVGKGNSSSKRQITPDNSLSNKRHASASLTFGSPAAFSPTSYKAHTPTAGSDYSSRKNKGQVVIRYEGNPSTSIGSIMPANFWKGDSSFIATVSNFFAKKISPSTYDYMFETLRAKAGVMDEAICRVGDILTEKNWKIENGNDGLPMEPIDFCLVQPEPFPTIGRICCDAAEGRLNSKSIILQGSQDLTRGCSLPLEVSSVSDFSLFPGQIVAAKVANPNGGKLIAHSIWNDASAPPPSTKIRLQTVSDSLNVVVASAPFTSSENFDYEPLKDLLEYVKTNQPQVLILCGPFLDERHKLVKNVSLEKPFAEVFLDLMKMIDASVSDLCTQVVVVPSMYDCQEHITYPVLPLDFKNLSDKMHMASDPCMLDIEGIVFGITSTDILFHLGKEEISHPPHSGDRLRRLANHLVQQRSFYPLYPPNLEMSIDYGVLEEFGQMPVQPHVLVLPSDLLHFYKELNGCLIMNPQRLYKGESGGVFARLKIGGLKEEDGNKPFVHRVHAEIVRI